MGRKPRTADDPYGDKARLAKKRPKPATDRERAKPLDVDAKVKTEAASPEPAGKKRDDVGPGKPPVEHQFKPGNPGRAKGSRNKLGEAFLTAMHDDFVAHGANVIATVRVTKPDQYLKVVASILPQQLNVTVQPFEEMTDDQLRKHAERLIAELGPVAAFASGRDAERATDPKAGKSLN